MKLINQMKKYGARAACLGTVALVGASQALAVGVADADISTTVDNNTATWLLVKGSIIAIGGFLVGYGFFKRIRRA